MDVAAAGRGVNEPVRRRPDRVGVRGYASQARWGYPAAIGVRRRDLEEPAVVAGV